MLHFNSPLKSTIRRLWSIVFYFKLAALSTRDSLSLSRSPFKLTWGEDCSKNRRISTRKGWLKDKWEMDKKFRFQPSAKNFAIFFLIQYRDFTKWKTIFGVIGTLKPVFETISNTDANFLNLHTREFKKTTTATATSLNKRFNEKNNSCARAL